MDSAELKTVALQWLRFGKRCPLVCTEVGRWNADVVGVTPSTVTEVEVKTSIADLRRDFRNKVAKHQIYTHAQENNPSVPNFFYFLMPSQIADKAAQILEEEKSKAGIIACTADAVNPFTWKHHLSVIKRATKLRSSPPTRDFVETMMLRCSSEICGLHLWSNGFAKKIEEQIAASKAETSMMVARAAGTLDIEEPSDDLIHRAQELAFCVEGLDFGALPENEKIKWLEASQRLLSAQFVERGGWFKNGSAG
jgi:hypothetical protein